MKRFIYISKGCPSQAEWTELLHGRIPAARVEAMEAHLERCPVCPEVVSALGPTLPRGVVAMIGDASGADFRGFNPRPSPPSPECTSTLDDSVGSADNEPPPFERAGDYV